MKRYVNQKVKTKIYLIKDIDCEIIVEETTRKELLSYLDEYIENLESGFDMSDFAFHILYNTGDTVSIVDNDYDGQPIRRQNILSMVYDNPSTSITYGAYAINAYGVVTPSVNMEIDENIEEVK
jgi:hypothetical protein